MMTIPRPKSGYLKERLGIATDSGRAGADDYEEEYDRIESLPFDAEHDEDDRDPEPERRPYSEHAQEAHTTARRTDRVSRREGKSWI